MLPQWNEHRTPLLELTHTRELWDVCDLARRMSSIKKRSTEGKKEREKKSEQSWFVIKINDAILFKWIGERRNENSAREQFQQGDNFTFFFVCFCLNRRIIRRGVPWKKLLLVQGLVSLVLGYDTGPIRPNVQIHAERLRQAREQRLRRVLLDAQATLQRAVTENTETDLYSSLTSSTIVLQEQYDFDRRSYPGAFTWRYWHGPWTST